MCVLLVLVINIRFDVFLLMWCRIFGFKGLLLCVDSVFVWCNKLDIKVVLLKVLEGWIINFLGLLIIIILLFL